MSVAKKPNLETLECHQLVVQLSKEMHAVAVKGTEHVSDKQRWVLVSRAISFLFAGHFNTAYHSAEKLIKEQEGEAR